MSIPTLIGFLAGVGLFIGAIMSATDNYLSFLSGSSIVMVLGGTLAATFIGYQGRYVMLALKDIGNLFIKGKADRKLLTVETGKIIRWGYLVKKSGCSRSRRRSRAPRIRITSSTTASSWSSLATPARRCAPCSVPPPTAPTPAR